MNINPLANQKRRYRILITVSILVSAIVLGWLLAQLVVSVWFSPFAQANSGAFLPQKTEVLPSSRPHADADLISYEELRHHQARLLLQEQRLYLLQALSRQEGISPELRKHLRHRCQLLGHRLNQHKLAVSIAALKLELHRLERRFP